MSCHQLKGESRIQTRRQMCPTYCWAGVIYFNSSLLLPHSKQQFRIDIDSAADQHKTQPDTKEPLHPNTSKQYDQTLPRSSKHTPLTSLPHVTCQRRSSSQSDTVPFTNSPSGGVTTDLPPTGLTTSITKPSPSSGTITFASIELRSISIIQGGRLTTLNQFWFIHLVFFICHESRRS
jgi:hypothetical protein